MIFEDEGNKQPDQPRYLNILEKQNIKPIRTSGRCASSLDCFGDLVETTVKSEERRHSGSDGTKRGHFRTWAGGLHSCYEVVALSSILVLILV